MLSMKWETWIFGWLVGWILAWDCYAW